LIDDPSLQVNVQTPSTGFLCPYSSVTKKSRIDNFNLTTVDCPGYKKILSKFTKVFLGNPFYPALGGAKKPNTV